MLGAAVQQEHKASSAAAAAAAVLYTLVAVTACTISATYWRIVVSAGYNRRCSCSNLAGAQGCTCCCSCRSHTIQSMYVYSLHHFRHSVPCFGACKEEQEGHEAAAQQAHNVALAAAASSNSSACQQLASFQQGSIL